MGGPRTDSVRADLAAAGLLPEPIHLVPGPTGAALSASTSLQHQRRKRRLSASQRGALLEGGWRVVSIKGGDEEGGVTSHRGVLHPDEYVDTGALQDLVEAELGFTYAEVRSVYRQGPLSADARQLRDALDARLLALSRAGTNLAELARLIGLTVRPEGDCQAFTHAINRAKEES